MTELNRTFSALVRPLALRGKRSEQRCENVGIDRLDQVVVENCFLGAAAIAAKLSPGLFKRPRVTATASRHLISTWSS
jgi:hypothetical protein